MPCLWEHNNRHRVGENRLCFFALKNIEKILKKYQKSIDKGVFVCYNSIAKAKKEVKMKVKELAEKTNLSQSRIYQIAKKLGRLPTIEEVEKQKEKRGRPKKYE